MHLAMAKLEVQAPQRGTSLFADAHEDPFDLFVDSDRCAASNNTLDRYGVADWSTFAALYEPNAHSSSSSSSSSISVAPPQPGRGTSLAIRQPFGRARLSESGAGVSLDEMDPSQKHAAGRSVSFPSSSSSLSHKPAASESSLRSQHRSSSTDAGKATASTGKHDPLPPVMAHASFTRSDFHDFWLQRTQNVADGFTLTPPSYYTPDLLTLPSQSSRPSPVESSPSSQYAHGRSFGSSQHSVQHHYDQDSLSPSFHADVKSRYSPATTPLHGSASPHFGAAHLPVASGPNTPYTHAALSPVQFHITYDDEGGGAPWAEGGSPSFGHASDFDESKVQPWWPPTTNRASAHGQPCTEYSAAYHGAPHPLAESLMARTADESPFVLRDSALAGNGLLIQCEGGELATSNPDRSTPFSERSSSARGDASLRGSRQSHSPSPPTSTTTASASNRGRDRARGHTRSKTSSSGGSSSSTRQPSMGFVNYTADDSKKILTGVAPSGSSKTKARREKEAAEKRRQLTLAAAKIVQEAGGDVAVLERAGFL